MLFDDFPIYIFFFFIYIYYIHIDVGIEDRDGYKDIEKDVFPFSSEMSRPCLTTLEGI